VITRLARAIPYQGAQPRRLVRLGPHVNDDLGDELFIVSFAFMLGKRIEVAMLAVQSPIAPLRRCVVGKKQMQASSSRLPVTRIGPSVIYAWAWP
jgi:hypothetical protein